VPNKKTRNRIHVSTGNPDLDRAFGQVYDDLNDINNKVVQPKTVEKAKNTDKVKGVEINDSDKADGKSLVFNSKTNKLDYKIITSETTSLNEVDDDIILLNTSITSYAIDTSVIESGNTLTVGSGVEFAVTEVDRDMSQIESDISNNASEVSKANSTASVAKSIANSALANSESNQENISVAISAINSLTSLISNELGVSTDEIIIG
jgi:hypothetical protein